MQTTSEKEPRCLIPAHEVMRRAGIRSPNTLRSWIASGKLPPLITIGEGGGARHFGVEAEVDAAIARLIDQGKQRAEKERGTGAAGSPQRSEQMRRVRGSGGAK